MHKDDIFGLFRKMMDKAEQELEDYTTTAQFISAQKPDKSIVTNCDKHLDAVLSKIAAQSGLPVVSEEGEHAIEAVNKGNYITVDPIDGTMRYVRHVEEALANGGMEVFRKKDLGARWDFGLLIGVVIEGKPAYGGCLNYVNGERIFIDGSDKNNLVREGNRRLYSSDTAIYTSNVNPNEVESQAEREMGAKLIRQGTQIKHVYTFINDHQDAATVHLRNSIGLWDVLPGACAARAFEGVTIDALGDPLLLNKYMMLPGTGAATIKGEKLLFIRDFLKKR